MRNKVYPFYFVLGALILYLLFFVLPTFMGFFYALTDWNSYSSDLNYVGLANFKLIFSSNQGYLHYISNTIIFTITTIIIKTVIALGLAILLTQGIRRLAYLHRVVIYLPAVLPMLAVSLIFRSILNPATGPAEYFPARHWPGFPGPEMVGGSLLGDALGHWCGYLERCWVHHGDPDRRDRSHSQGIL